ncbi:hypothetical protein CLAVI_000536 [Candidatus Clavichlamydia salmonicola]|uniref:hypothetical protein n=1 Tax=Candidatus Clavichlamydia salmonicola TaxID=469812 RepID=UPI001890E375|nr:hypothetical protein [Candidatus Clavichlamydia salmonicola]MBF5050914.1 hypothetical protein [Candidatus Clavichlamydia salmonicola]
MSFISNYLGLIPPKNASAAVRNCKHNMKRLCRLPALQAPISTLMGISMAVLTNEIFNDDPIINNHPSSSPSSRIFVMKIATLIVMEVANSALLADALTSICGRTSITALNPKTPARNHRLYILTNLNLAASSLGLISITSFVSSSTMQNRHPNPLQALAITSGSLSSVIYTVKAIITLMMYTAKAIPQREIEIMTRRWQPIDAMSLISTSINSDLDSENDAKDVCPLTRTPSPIPTRATLIEIKEA